MPQQALLQLAAAAEALSQKLEARDELGTAARKAWCGGNEPIPAEAPQWPGDSVGERLFTGTFLDRARSAPCLLTAYVPDAALITADPAHWSVAADALIRAVVFDGLRVDHPTVSMLLDVLAPIAEAEMAHGEAMEAWLNSGWELDEDGPEFPELDGPVCLLGTCVLVEATWALVGNDRLSEVLAALESALDGAVPGLEAQIMAEALVGAFATHYRCELPGDADVIRRIGPTVPGNALENLVTSGAVAPRDTIRVGLTILSVLAELGKSGSASILQRIA